MINKRVLFILAVVAAGLVLFKVYMPVVSHYHELKIQEEQNERTIAELNQKIITLEEEKSLLESDSEYLEKVIRQELGMVRPGEIVYKFIEDQALVMTPEVIPGTDQAVQAALQNNAQVKNSSLQAPQGRSNL
ncbi:septum formation initiator family protein [Omnitrophica bacterium]|nr:septum formation initiator family protein [Candidatus Omnitrophota bacterium]